MPLRHFPNVRFVQVHTLIVISASSSFFYHLCRIGAASNVRVSSAFLRCSSNAKVIALLFSSEFSNRLRSSSAAAADNFAASASLSCVVSSSNRCVCSSIVVDASASSLRKEQSASNARSLALRRALLRRHQSHLVLGKGEVRTLRLAHKFITSTFRIEYLQVLCCDAKTATCASNAVILEFARPAHLRSDLSDVSCAISADCLQLGFASLD